MSCISRHWLLAAALFGLSVPAAQARSVALLVGISAYPQPENRLEGPKNDVASLQAVLTQKWGFLASDVRVLLDKDATRTRILDEIDALMTRSVQGDEVFVYFSGHGVSARDGAGLPLPHTSGAFVAFDSDGSRGGAKFVETLVVGARDLRPRFDRLDKGGRKVLFVSDSCYSGQQARSVFGASNAGAQFRYWRGAPADTGGDEFSSDFSAGVRPKAEPFPYRDLLFLSAASDGEPARDLSGPVLQTYPSIDGKAHGALTDTLLRVLSGNIGADTNRDGRLDFVELHAAVSDFMSQRGYGHAPQRLPTVAEDVQGSGRRALFAGSSQPAASATPAASVGNAALSIAVGSFGGSAQLAQQLSRIPGIKPVSGSNADLVVQLAGKQLRLLSRSGDLLSLIPADDMTNATARLMQSIAGRVWAQRLKQLADSGKRATLGFEADPGTRGGTFADGEALRFVLRPDRDGVALIVNIDGAGNVTTLYPASQREAAPLRSGAAATLPADGSSIRVQPPYGTDHVFAFVFDSAPPQLERLMQLQGLPTGDTLATLLIDSVEQLRGRYAFHQFQLRTLPREAFSGKPQ